jgi:hypothetical protein
MNCLIIQLHIAGSGLVTVADLDDCATFLLFFTTRLRKGFLQD